MTSFAVPVSHLKALAPFMSRDETRAAICGIQVEVSREGRRVFVTLVATDGRRIFALGKARRR